MPDSIPGVPERALEGPKGQELWVVIILQKINTHLQKNQEAKTKPSETAGLSCRYGSSFLATAEGQGRICEFYVRILWILCSVCETASGDIFWHLGRTFQCPSDDCGCGDWRMTTPLSQTAQLCHKRAYRSPTSVTLTVSVGMSVFLGPIAFTEFGAEKSLSFLVWGFLRKWGDFLSWHGALQGSLTSIA